MKKLFLIILISLLLISNVNAQRKITGMVTYSCYVNIGMGKSNFEANLFFNTDSSYFQTVNNSVKKDTTAVTQKDKVIEAKVSIPIQDTTGFKIIVDNKSKKMYSREIIINKFISVYENTPNLNWVINNETKKIGNNYCQKATCSFRGRNYIAWFSKDIGINAGPYKFQGLPGLILEVTDEKGQIGFTMKTITIPFKNTIPVNPKYSPEPISRNDYILLAKKSVERLTKYLQSSSRTEATTGRITVKSSIIGIEDLDVPL